MVVSSRLRAQYEDRRNTHHRSVEVGFPLCGGGEECELRDAEDLAIDVLDVLLPHSTRGTVGKDLQRQAAGIACIIEVTGVRKRDSLGISKITGQAEKHHGGIMTILPSEMLRGRPGEEHAHLFS